MGALCDLENAILPILPPGVVAEIIDPTRQHGGIFDVEIDAMSHAVPRRRAEYSAGRIGAHRAMQRLGFAPMPVLNGEDRAPIWPTGITGSISHCGGACVVLMTKTSNFQSIGVDVEDNLPLPIDAIETVCLPQEILWLDTLPKTMRNTQARQIFSAKECTYKCQYQITKNMFDFNTLHIDLDVETCSFSATFKRPMLPFLAGAKLTGRMVQTNKFMLSVMCLA